MSTTTSDSALEGTGVFFGMTTLGATDAFRDSASMGAGYKFHSIPESAYLAAFDGAVLGAGSATSCALGLPDEQAAASMLRSKLGEVLDEALGRSATLQEVKAWYKFLDFDAGGCIIGRPEFTAAIAALRNFSSRPGRAVSYNSHARWVADRAQHRRVDWEARTCLQEPLTAAQQIGWHAAKPHGQDLCAPPQRTLPHTDVTRGEGRTAASYYGHLTLLGS